jgi:hypothetical protein
MNDWAKFESTVATKIWNGAHDETAMIAAQLSSGTTVEICSSVQFGPYNRIEIFGSKGRAICKDTLGRNGAGEILVNDIIMGFDSVDPFKVQLQNVINHIENSTLLNADVISGIRSVKDLKLSI